jgi:two-component system nitrogen regulation response regulator NtrX
MNDSPTTVLVVEDEALLQDVYKLVLETKGFSVVTANNGKEALKIMSKSSPDVILLDMLMPVMSGREFMHMLNRDEHPNIRIIVYSNLSDSSIEAEMLELGADRFILKSSMTPAGLVDMIQEAKTQ